MPSTITHELIAKSAAALLKREHRQAALSEPDYYYLGAQGPDLFFFYQPQKKGNFGKALHRGGLFRWFEALLSALSSRTGEERQKCLAYALGFCTHLEADVAFHPFVYGYLEENHLKKREHQRIENDWDVYFVATLEEKGVRGYKWPFDLKKIAREGVLYAYLRDAANIWGKKIERGAFNRCLRFFRWFLKHFHRKHFRYLLPVLPQLYPRRTPDPEITENPLFSRLTKAENADALFLSAAEHSAERMEEFLTAAEQGSPLSAAFSRHLLTGEEAPLMLTLSVAEGKASR